MTLGTSIFIKRYLQKKMLNTGGPTIVMMALLLLVELNEIRSDVSCPKRLCICTNGTANCSNHGSNLCYIPKLPSSIRVLNFSNNFLVNITKTTFEPIRGLLIEKLRLADNHIQYISKDAFEMLPNLKYLYLTGNGIPVDILMNSFYGLRNSKLQNLILSHMHLPNLPENMFLNLENCPIIMLGLSFNKMTIFNGLTFRRLRSLNTLNVADNNISFVDLRNLPRIQTLYLRWNRLTKIPKLCNNENRSMLPNVLKLDLANNFITNITPEKLKNICLPNIRSIRLDSNPIELIPDNIFSDLNTLTYLTLTWMKVFKFRFGKFAFNISSLQFLYIQNRLNFPQDVDYIQNIFKGCPKLKILNMSKNNLVKFSADMLYTLFSTLRNLRKLILQQTLIQNIPSNLFQLMPFLWNLNLKNNYIHGWDPKTFQNVTNLRYLYLDYNQISVINQSSFPSEVLKKITHLDLGYNPFSCTCSLFWFKNWIRNNKMKLLSYPTSYICSSPPHLARIQLEKFNPSYGECFPLSPYIILGIVLTVVIITGVIVTGALYKYRWHIKHYIYLLYSKREYKRISGDDVEYLYDAFVAYNSKDTIWVISELIPCLEKQENMKLCVHERDFDVGHFIVDNIINKINKSRRVILILSNEFAKSQWCKFETMMAQNRHIQEGGEVLIIVMLENIKTRYMSNSLHSVLQSTTFIEWTTEEPGRQLFWNRLVACVKG